MKIVKGIANFIGILAALILSIALIAVLAVTPLIYTAADAMEPERIQEIAMSAFESLLSEQGETAVQEMTNAGFPPDVVEAALESQAVKELIDLYVEDVFGQLDGAESKLNTQALRQIAENNMDELIPIVRELTHSMVDGETEIPDEDVEEAILDMVDIFGPELIDMLPSVEDLELTQTENGEMLSVWDADTLERAMNGELSNRQLVGLLAQAMQIVYDGTALKALLTAAGVLCLLILFFRMGGFRGFTWLGIDFMIGAVPCIMLGFSAKVGLVQIMSMEGVPPVLSVADPVIDKVLCTAVVIFIVGIVFGMISAKGQEMLEKHRAKKRAAQNM